ncbi:hypothetical protein ACJX0J_034626, partial [Zea mays]
MENPAHHPKISHYIISITIDDTSNTYYLVVAYLFWTFLPIMKIFWKTLRVVLRMLMLQLLGITHELSHVLPIKDINIAHVVESGWKNLFDESHVDHDLIKFVFALLDMFTCVWTLTPC